MHLPFKKKDQPGLTKLSHWQIIPLGVDIGGSIMKIIYFGPKECTIMPKYVKFDSHLDGEYPVLAQNINEEKEDYCVRFAKVPISNMDHFFNFVKHLDHDFPTFGITGGGAFKYKDSIEKLGITYNKKDEIQSLITGLNFAIINFDNEIFTYGWRSKQKTVSENPISYPYLLVNIGSGVSIMRVDGPDSFKRVTGTSLGGGTFWGLCRMITGITNFEEVEKYSDTGDNKKVDLLVEDIYGGDYDDIGLPGYVIASSFAKVMRSEIVEQCDVVKSLLYMISDNICQIAYLAIKEEKENIRDVLFTGSFTNIGPVLWKKLSYGIEFWSDGSMEAKFLEHEGYFGAIGVCL